MSSGRASNYQYIDLPSSLSFSLTQKCNLNAAFQNLRKSNNVIVVAKAITSPQLTKSHLHSEGRQIKLKSPQYADDMLCMTKGPQ